MKFPYSFRFGSRIAWLSISLFPFAGPIGLAAESSSSMTLEEVLLLTQEHNPELRSLEQKYEAARHRVPQISSLPDPRLQVMHFVEPVQTRTGPQKNVISLSQTIPWFGTLKQREVAAAAEAKTLWFAHRSKHLQVMRDVALEYYEFAYLERAVKLTGQNLNLLKQLEPIVEERVRGGGDLNALLRLKVENGRLTNRRDSLQEQISSVKSSLLAKIGLPVSATLPSPAWQIPSRIHWSTESLLKSLERGNPELAAIERQELSAQARVELARLGGFPDFTLGLNYIQLGESINPITPDSGKDPWGLTLSVNLPIFRGKYRSAKSEALATARSIDSALENRRNLLTGELLSALSKLEDAQRRLDLYEGELLPLAGQALEISRIGYENGRTGILEVIDSERTLRELQLENWRAAADAWKSRIVIRSMTEIPLEESLMKEK